MEGAFGSRTSRGLVHFLGSSLFLIKTPRDRRYQFTPGDILLPCLTFIAFKPGRVVGRNHSLVRCGERNPDVSERDPRRLSTTDNPERAPIHLYLSVSKGLCSKEPKGREANR